MPAVRGKVFPRSGNDLWPLPPDYYDLTIRGQQMARLNACRLQQTPELAVHGWRFFTDYYLRPWVNPDGTEFNPGFYQEWKAPVGIHLQMIHAFEADPRSLIVFPRGHAKSTTANSYLLYKLVTNPQFLANAYLAKYKPLVQRLSDHVRTQVEYNPRLISDFSDLKPARGTGVWSTDYIRLTNFSSLAMFSIDGNLRGPRAHFNLIDDIEKDPDGGKLPDPETVEAVKDKIVRVLLPMLKEGSRLGWCGTLFHQRSAINHIATNDNDPTSPDFDPRFASVENGGTWRKLIFTAYDADGSPVWQTKEYLDQMYKELGPAAFSSEFLNKPISTADTVFNIDPLLHEYTIEKPDDSVYVRPFESGAIVQWSECSGYPVKSEVATERWATLVESLNRGITVDPIRNPSASSDFAAVVVGGVDARNNLWLLDLAVFKLSNTALCHELFKLVRIWRPTVVGVESVGFTEEFFHQAAEQQTVLLDEIGYVPQCIPLKPPTNLTKGQRIRRIEWRYTHGKIKYPFNRRGAHPWPMLYDQTLRFTEDLANLKYDDCIDAVEMLQQLFKGQRATGISLPVQRTAVDRFLDGERQIPGTDIPTLQLCDLRRMDPETRERVLAAAEAAASSDDDPTYY